VVTQAVRTAATIGAVLDSARELFMERGFTAVSIDDIAAGAGVGKGAVYHHFRSKQDIFEAVLDMVQAELAQALEERIRSNKGKRTPRTIASNVLAYLLSANEDGYRRLILIEGPLVLGWQKWREIEDRHFMASVRTGIEAIVPQGTTQAEVESATSLAVGAIVEAARIVGTADDPQATARLHCKVLEAMLRGLQAG
jgi:AcrR family transcriptional regulator